MTDKPYENDVDYQVAKELASAVISAKAFERISDEAFNRSLVCMRSCAKVINCLISYGEMNAQNRALAEAAKRFQR